MREVPGYTDFTLEVSPLEGSSYRLRARSVRGEAHGRVTLTRALLGIDPHSLGEHGGSPLNEDLGQHLFRALFPAEIGNRFHESLGASATDGRGIRLRLQLDLTEGHTVGFHGIPWELLCRPATGRFLALDRHTSIVRSLDVALPPVARAPWEFPLRLLVASAQPADLPPLGIDRELAAIRGSWWKQHRLRVRVCRDTTLDHLGRVCAEEDIQILHLIQHGLPTEASDGGSLVFDDGDGGCQAIDGPQLAAQLAGLKSLRLVVISACWSGRSPHGRPNAGIATALIQAGIAAVVALQAPLPDTVAQVFSLAFYESLRRGRLPETAVTEGRLALARRFPDALFWAVPVVFLRAEAEPPTTQRSDLSRVTRPLLAVSLLLGSIGLGLRTQDSTHQEGPHLETSDTAIAPRMEPESPSSLDMGGGVMEDASQVSASDKPTTEVPGTEHVLPVDRSEPTALEQPESLASWITLSDGETHELLPDQLYVTLSFYAWGQAEWARLDFFTSSRNTVLQTQIAQGPTSFNVETLGGSVVVQVLAVDRATRTVRLRIRSVFKSRLSTP